MKKLSLILLLLTFTLGFKPQDNQKLPNIDMKTLEGKVINSSEFSNNGKPYIISFWATWCKSCIVELNNIQENYEDWQEETGLKVIAVSIDDARNSSKVLPYVNSQGWDFEVYLDVNKDFYRAMNVINPPHTFIIDANNTIAYSHNGYVDGQEFEYYDIIEKLIAGKPIH